MKLLLDTCTFLWIPIDSPELSQQARLLFQNPENEVYLSAASAWEISIKYHLGRLPLPEVPERFVPKLREKYRIDFLPIDEESALTIHRLPKLHRDPFDRMLISQAIVHGLTLLTPDDQIRQYAIRTDW